jgi:DNA-binding IclR family transcriptional regulator
MDERRGDVRASSRQRVPARAARATSRLSSVDNALRLLLMLRERESIRVSVASAQLGVSRSTAHRLLTTLKLHDLLEQDPETRAYRAGPLLAELGASALRNDDVLMLLHPFLEELSDQVGETAHLVVLDGRNCRFVDSVECRWALRTTARVGVAYPAHTTSGGKALLAELGDDELERLFPELELPSLNERSLTSRDALLAELAQVRADGYAVARGESELGVVAVAMAQRTMTGAVPAAFAISAPEQRFPESRIRAGVAALREITERARRRLP